MKEYAETRQLKALLRCYGQVTRTATQQHSDTDLITFPYFVSQLGSKDVITRPNQRRISFKFRAFLYVKVKGKSKGKANPLDA
jgi:hypothetical protein